MKGEEEGKKRKKEDKGNRKKEEEEEDEEREKKKDEVTAIDLSKRFETALKEGVGAAEQFAVRRYGRK